MRRASFLAVLVALVGFQAWWFQRQTPTETRLERVAGEIAGHPVDVYCPSLWKRLIDVSSFKGEAYLDANGPGTHATLAHDVCVTFEDLPDKGFPDLACLSDGEAACDDWRRDVALAIHVLAHESWHLAGVTDESITECYAVQTDASLARTFGASPAAAEQLAAFHLKRGPSASLPQYRISTDCSRPRGSTSTRPRPTGRAASARASRSGETPAGRSPRRRRPPRTESRLRRSTCARS